jgi:NADPH2:quinone reductase
MEIAKRLGGADYVINYSKPGWQKEVLALTNDRGVDVIYDPVGLINGNSIRALSLYLLMSIYRPN